MRYLAVVNYEQLDDIAFFVANLYDDTGQLADQIITPKRTIDEAVIKLRELALYFEITNFEVWTSDKALFKRLLTEAGIGASLKERGETIDTNYAVHQHAELLREFYHIEEEPKHEKVGFIRKIFKTKRGKLKSDAKI